MGKKNATCSICGKAYHKCLSCADMMATSPWKRHTDTSEHYKIYQILHGYFTGVFTKEEAKDRLQNADLSDLETLRDHVKESIKDILKEEKVSFREDRRPMRRILEKPVKVEPVEEQVEDEASEEEQEQ